MLDVERYPSLQQTLKMLDEEEYPAADPQARPVKKTETVLGTLTAGEAHLYLAMIAAKNEAHEAKQGINDPDEVTPEVMKKVATEAYLDTIFWHFVGERFGDAVPNNIGIREGFQVVARPPAHDCGCGRGYECGAVLAGIIDPETGEERSSSLGGGLEQILGGLFGGNVEVVRLGG